MINLSGFHLSSALIFCVGCQTGDIMLVNKKPMIYWKGRYLEICGDNFWNDNNGANLICDKIYDGDTGTADKTVEQSTVTRDALMIGTCQSTDTDILQCTGGSNTYEIKPYNECNTANTLTITCSGSSRPERTCPGI